MQLERTFEGLQITTRPRGIARFGVVAFLSVWLCGWLAGECFALWALVSGVLAVLTGRPLNEGDAPLSVTPAVTAGLFLLLWLSLWSVGGFFAIREWLRLVFGRQRITVRSDGLYQENHYGLFTTRRLIPAADILRFFVTGKSPALAVETTDGVVSLLGNALPDELASAAEILNGEFKRDKAPPPNGNLPSAWKATTSAEAQTVLVKDPATRRKVQLGCQLVAGVLAIAAVLLATDLSRTLAVLPFSLILAAASAGLFWLANRLVTRVEEWVVEPKILRLQIRTGMRLTTEFEAVAIQLDDSTDSDGDRLYRLLALAKNEPMASSGILKKADARLLHRVSDSLTPEIESFARYLVARTHLPFHDLTSPAVKSQDFEAMRAKLAASGRIGAWLAKHIRPPRG